MDKLIVKPLEAVGNVKFGMMRTDVRELLGEFTEFKKTKFSKNTTDDFEFCHVYYNKDDKCEAVEIFDTVEVIVDGQVVFPGNISGAKKVFGQLVQEGDDYTDVVKSVGIYAPSGKMETILFGETGYYD